MGDAINIMTNDNTDCDNFVAVSVRNGDHPRSMWEKEAPTLLRGWGGDRWLCRRKLFRTIHELFRYRSELENTPNITNTQFDTVSNAISYYQYVIDVNDGNLGQSYERAEEKQEPAEQHLPTVGKPRMGMIGKLQSQATKEKVAVHQPVVTPDKIDMLEKRNDEQQQLKKISNEQQQSEKVSDALTLEKAGDVQQSKKKDNLQAPKEKPTAQASESSGGGKTQLYSRDETSEGDRTNVDKRGDNAMEEGAKGDKESNNRANSQGEKTTPDRDGEEKWKTGINSQMELSDKMNDDKGTKDELKGDESKKKANAETHGEKSFPESNGEAKQKKRVSSLWDLLGSNDEASHDSKTNDDEAEKGLSKKDKEPKKKVSSEVQLEISFPASNGDEKRNTQDHFQGEQSVSKDETEKDGKFKDDKEAKNKTNAPTAKEKARAQIHEGKNTPKGSTGSRKKRKTSKRKQSNPKHDSAKAGKVKEDDSNKNKLNSSEGTKVEHEECTHPNDNCSKASDSSIDEEEFFYAQHNSVCEVCSDGGVLLCCSTCTLVFHQVCSLPTLNDEPPEDWSCAYCVSTGLTGYKSNSKVRRLNVRAVQEMERIKKGELNIEDAKDEATIQTAKENSAEKGKEVKEKKVRKQGKRKSVPRDTSGPDTGDKQGRPKRSRKKVTLFKFEYEATPKINRRSGKEKKEKSSNEKQIVKQEIPQANENNLANACLKRKQELAGLIDSISPAVATHGDSETSTAQPSKKFLEENILESEAVNKDQKTSQQKCQLNQRQSKKRMQARARHEKMKQIKDRRKQQLEKARQKRASQKKEQPKEDQQGKEAQNSAQLMKEQQANEQSEKDRLEKEQKEKAEREQSEKDRLEKEKREQEQQEHVKDESEAQSLSSLIARSPTGTISLPGLSDGSKSSNPDPLPKNLTNATTEQICEWLSKRNITRATLEVLVREEIDGTFLFEESLDEVKNALKGEGVKLGQISKIRKAIKDALTEGSLISH